MDFGAEDIKIISILQKYDYGLMKCISCICRSDFNSTEVRLWCTTETDDIGRNEISILQKYDYGTVRRCPSIV